MAHKHKNPTRENRTAVAPYNFVPVTDHVVAFPETDNPLTVDNQSRYHLNRLTGWIDVEIETMSPTYVRGSLSPDEYEKAEREDKDPNDKTPHLKKVRNKPEFFHQGNPNAPAIPGSSLRGMIRSLVEIVSKGKLQPVTNTKQVYRVLEQSEHGLAYRDQLFQVDESMRSKDPRNHYLIPRFKGGYIRRGLDGQWYIQPAQKLKGGTFSRLKGDKDEIDDRELPRWTPTCPKIIQAIYIKVGNAKYHASAGNYVNVKRGTILSSSKTEQENMIRVAVARSGTMQKKKSELVVYPPDNNAELIRIPDGTDPNDENDLVTAYLDQVSNQLKKLLGARGVLRGQKSKGDPVKIGEFEVIDDSHPILYALDKHGKLVFFGHTQMFRFPYRNSPRDLLSDEHKNENTVDYAEAMFGRVLPQKQNRAENSAIAGRVFFSDATLMDDQDDIWESDKPIVPRILASPKPTTFQHYLTQSSEKKFALNTYNHSRDRTTLRGHKKYWHRKGLRSEDYTVSQREQQGHKFKESQHTQMRPVRENIKFGGKIRFENLLPSELGALWWAIALPIEDKREYWHQIGMGKPLGLGSVKLTPTLTLIDSEVRYKSFSRLGKRNEQETGQKLGSAISQFETDVYGNTSIQQDERIQMLLTMMENTGLPFDSARYMEIERRMNPPRPIPGKGDREKWKFNEYSERPVLPDPIKSTQFLTPPDPIGFPTQADANEERERKKREELEQQQNLTQIRRTRAYEMFDEDDLPEVHEDEEPGDVANRFMNFLQNKDDK